MKKIKILTLLTLMLGSIVTTQAQTRSDCFKKYGSAAAWPDDCNCKSCPYEDFKALNDCLCAVKEKQSSSSANSKNESEENEETKEVEKSESLETPINLTRLKSDLYETKAMLERTGQTDTEEYRKTVASINAVKQQLNRKNSSYSGTSNSSKPTYSQTMRQTQREINRTNQAFDQAKDAWGNFMEGQRQKIAEQSRREEAERQRKIEDMKRQSKIRDKIARDKFRRFWDLSNKSNSEIKFYLRNPSKALSVRELFLYNSTKAELEALFPLFQNLEILELKFQGDTLPESMVNLKKLKKLTLSTIQKPDEFLMGGIEEEFNVYSKEEIFLPEGFKKLESLEYLQIDNRGEFTIYRKGDLNFKKLKIVKFKDSRAWGNIWAFGKSENLEKMIFEDYFLNISKIWRRMAKRGCKSFAKKYNITVEFKDKIFYSN